MFCNKNIEISVWLYYIVFRSFVTIALKKKKVHKLYFNS